MRSRTLRAELSGKGAEHRGPRRCGTSAPPDRRSAAQRWGAAASGPSPAPCCRGRRSRARSRQVKDLAGDQEGAATATESRPVRAWVVSVKVAPMRLMTSLAITVDADFPPQAVAAEAPPVRWPACWRGSRRGARPSAPRVGQVRGLQFVVEDVLHRPSARIAQAVSGHASPPRAAGSLPRPAGTRPSRLSRPWRSRERISAPGALAAGARACEGEAKGLQVVVQHQRFDLIRERGEEGRAASWMWSASMRWRTPILMLTSWSEVSTPAELSTASVLSRPPASAYSIRARWVMARLAPSPTTLARSMLASTRRLSLARSPASPWRSELRQGADAVAEPAGRDIGAAVPGSAPAGSGQ